VLAANRGRGEHHCHSRRDAGPLTPGSPRHDSGAEDRFSDPGAALTDLTQKARRSGTDITPVGSAFDDGRALCLRRQASTGDTTAVTACYSVNSTTLLLVLGGKSIQEVSNAMVRMEPALKTR
jgi:hypothetical protein